MAWQSLGSISVTATSSVLTIGPVDLPPYDGITLSVQQTSGQSPWPYGYGLLWVENSNGRELGTIKVFGHLEGESYRLGEGMSSLLGGGLLKFSPRLYNLRWLKASGAVWNLRFAYDKPSTTLPPNRYRSPGFEKEDGVPLTLLKVGSFGRIYF
jgi:hypothetical protein